MSKMTPTNRTGLTLIEVMVALAIGLIVMLGTSSFLAFAQKSWNREWDQANLQRDVARAMLKVKQSIRNGTHAQLDADGRGGEPVFMRRRGHSLLAGFDLALT